MANLVATQAISTASEDLTEPPETVSSVPLTVSVGSDPLAPGGPLTPVDSPVELALLAAGSRTRNESIDGVQTFTAAAMLTVNSAPSVPAQPVGIPDPVTGVVAGTVIATDPENNSLTYTVTTAPTQGSVQLNSQTGAYTYTPTQAARLAAGATSTVDTDSFSVAVSDGQQATTAPVSVYISPIRFENQAPIAVGTNPSAAVIGTDGRMWVANTGSNTVSVINTITGQRIDANSSYFSKDISVSSSPSALALSADGKRLYVANTGSGTVSVIDTATYKRIDTNPSAWGTQSISVGSSPSALAVGSDGRLYVANRGSNTVSVINTTTYKLVDVNPNVSGIQSISVGTAPSALAFTGGRLYVTNRGSSTVSVIDPSSYSVTNIAVGSQPSALAVGGSGRLFVVNTGSGTVSVIDTATNSVVKQAISVGPSPSSVAFSPNGSLAYVTNTNDTVSVIDTATNKVVSTVAIDTDTTGGHVGAVSSKGTLYVTDAVDKTVRVLTIRYGNAAPVAGTPTVGTPNVGSGAVTGALNFTDRDGDILSYSVTQPSSGTVAITGAGAYTFTPTLAARQAAATGGPTSTTFTVKATDGQAIASVNVTVPIAAPVAATSVTTLGSVSVNGYAWGPPLLSPDGTRAMLTTYLPSLSGTTTRVAVVNTTTGKQVGSTITLAGSPGSPGLSADGTHASIATSVYNPTTGIYTTQVTTIDLATGAQIANDTGTQAGTGAPGDSSPYADSTLNADHSRALITALVTDQTTGAESTRVAVVDTGTNAEIGTPFVLAGNVQPIWSGDRTRAVFITPVSDPSTGTSTQISVVNLDAGTYTSTTRAGAWSIPLIGPDYSPQLVSADGSRALIANAVTNPTTGAVSTRVAVIDTITGAQTGTTLALAGGEFGSKLVSANGSRALIVTNVYDGRTSVNTTRLTVIDTTTGTQIGPTTTLTGFLNGPVLFSANTGRAVIATISSNFATTGVGTTEVAVINTTTGAQVGSIFTYKPDTGSALLSADGTRALINTGSQLAVINTLTGTQAGATVTGGNYPLLTPDGTRALIVTGYNPTKLTVLQIR
ncbi:YVTN family beta-propeller protein/VCBS repeat-containing protein [Mycobacterium sp. OAS707]|uniref:Ig-like domain-containing protein n=1 Tax=Mycobacterium sp. OAS707 TaxID=2663822 RepID=UPI00178A04CB|nr:YVTN family beta-propeller protein/VCBS repeat-containing protein [Mycobacterium sp. OAS707]